MLSRYEVARLLGIRSLQISEGSEPRVLVRDERLRLDSIYVAAMEMYESKLDACVVRDGIPVHLSTLKFPLDVVNILNSRDGGHRVYGSSGALMARTSSVYDIASGPVSSVSKTCRSVRERPDL